VTFEKGGGTSFVGGAEKKSVNYQEKIKETHYRRKREEVCLFEVEGPTGSSFASGPKKRTQ